MNRAAKVAGGVYGELLQSHREQMIYQFGIMIGQCYGFSEEYCGPEKMREEVKKFENSIRSETMESILKALTLFADGMDWIEAMERCSGYYDGVTGRPWREINAEEEAASAVVLQERGTAT